MVCHCRGPEVGVEVAGEVVGLEGKEGAVLDGRDVVLVREADDGGEFVKGGRAALSRRVVAGPEIEEVNGI